MRISAALPTGVAALLFEAARRRRVIEEALAGHLLAAGFSEVILPVLDYSEPYEPLLSPAARGELYRFVGRDGELLALRADFTPLLARLLAPRLGSLPLPLRLFYRGDVVRYAEERAGRPRESFQLGAELVGEAGEKADGEMLGLFLELLSRAVSAGEAGEAGAAGAPGARGSAASTGLAAAPMPVQVVFGFAGALDRPLVEAEGLDDREPAGRDAAPDFTEPGRSRREPGSFSGQTNAARHAARPTVWHPDREREVRGLGGAQVPPPGSLVGARDDIGASRGAVASGLGHVAGSGLAAAVARRERAPLRHAPRVLLDVVERGVPRRPADLGPEAAARLDALLALRDDLARRFPGIDLAVDLAEFACQTLDPRLAPAPGGGERPYYDGIVFRAHAGPAGVEVGGGGRYDRLFRALGAEAPAMGFSLGIDRLPQGAALGMALATPDAAAAVAGSPGPAAAAAAETATGPLPESALTGSGRPRGPARGEVPR